MGRVTRVDDTHVVVFVQIMLAPGTRRTLIGHPPPPDAVIDEAGRPPLPTSYSMRNASLQVGEKRFGPANDSPYASPEITTWLTSGQGLEIPIEFDAPSPLPSGADGKRPAQSADLTLPEARQPISDVALPGDPSPKG